MRKEVLLAIVAGSLLGLTIAFGVWRANLALKPTTTNQDSTVSQEEKQKSPGLSIAQPLDFEVITDPKVSLKGIASTGSVVIISSADKDYFPDLHDDGSFSQEIKLNPGLNQILLTSFDPQGRESQKTLPLVYSGEFKKFLESEPSPTSSRESTQSADEVREKVMEKLSSASKKGTAFIGTVTDITQNSIQIKDSLGEILQISINEETEYAKVGTKTEEVQLQDLAIGDFIVAMGILTPGASANTRGTLSGMRILISSLPQDNKLKAVMGKVEKIEKKAINLSTSSGESWTANFGKSWDGPELTEIEEGQTAIVVGTADQNSLSARTLHMLEL